MRRPNIPVLKVLLAFTVGVVAYDYFTISAFQLGIGTLVAIILSFSFHLIGLGKRITALPFIVSMLFLFTSLGYLSRLRTDDLTDTNHYTQLDTPAIQTLLVSIKEQLKPTRYQDKFIAEVHTIGSRASAGDILLNISKDSLAQAPLIGDWFHIRTAILPVPQPKNPYQFDYGKYLERKQMYGQLSVRYSDIIRSSKNSSGPRVWSSRFRESVQDSLHAQSFSTKQLAIIEALVLGQKQGIDKEISSQYAAAGMMHILAVSGLHVGIILLILRFMFRPMTSRKLRWLKSLLIICLIWSFAFVTGLSPSVLRAATMFSFLEFGEAIGGKRKTQDAVLASALFLLLYDPLLIYQVGFQLSYLAVMAILWIQPWLASFWEPANYILRKVRDAASVTIAAQLGVMPLSLFYFHQFPGLFIISNVLIIPFLGIILGGGILVSLLAFVGMLPEWLIISYGSIINAMNGYIGWVAGQEAFIAKHISISPLLMMLFYVFLISLFAFLMKFSWRRFIIVSLSVLMVTGVLLFEKRSPPSSQLAILNKSRSTIVTQWNGNELKIFENDTTFNVERDTRITAYRNALSINDIEVDSLSSYFRFKQKEILVVDSLGIYQLETAQPDFILLTHSPRINLERLIERYPNTTIIADASNYRSYVERWIATCKNKKIPFHSTYEKGAYSIR